MPDLMPVAPDLFSGHMRECLRIIQAYGYKLFVNKSAPPQYYLFPPGSNTNGDPPGEFRLTQGDKTNTVKNPLELTPPNMKRKPNDLENTLDRVARDEMDLKQYDSRWQSYIYGPLGHNAGWVSGSARQVQKKDDGTTKVGQDKDGWTDLQDGGCGAMTMASVMGFLLRQKGLTPSVNPAQKDAQWGEVKDVTDWLGASPKHGRIKGSGTLQGKISLAAFEAKWPGFSLYQHPNVKSALAAIRADSFVVLNGAFGVFYSMPIAKTSMPDKYYGGHNIVLWSVEDAEKPHDFTYIRIFDPGGGGRYLLADHLIKGTCKYKVTDKDTKVSTIVAKYCGGEYWEPYKIVLRPVPVGIVDGMGPGVSRQSRWDM